MATYNKYTPDFKCSSDGNNKGVVNASVGLLSYDEVVYAGGYTNQKNSNYYLYDNNYFWIISPAGFSSYPVVWRVNSTGDIYVLSVSNSIGLRPVLNLTINTKTSSGDGTKENPFVVE